MIGLAIIFIFLSGVSGGLAIGARASQVSGSAPEHSVLHYSLVAISLAIPGAIFCAVWAAA